MEKLLRHFLGKGVWTKATLSLAIAIGIAETRDALGIVTLQETVEPIDARLASAGWMGIKVSFIADAPGEKVGGFDLKNNISQVRGTSYYLNGVSEICTGLGPGPYPGYQWLLSKDLPIGISGPLHQTWNVDEQDGVMQTPAGTSQGGLTATDSHFLNSNLFETMDPLTEDNNLISNVGVGNLSGSPLVDVIDGDGNGKEYGVGSSMTFSAGITWQVEQTSLDLAFLIVPRDGANVFLRGFNDDNHGILFAFDVVLNPAGFGDAGDGSVLTPTVSSVPEPATVAWAGIMLGMLIKRRKKF